MFPWEREIIVPKHVVLSEIQADSLERADLSRKTSLELIGKPTAGAEQDATGCGGGVG